MATLNHHIIIVAGLGDDVKATKFWTKSWEKEHINVEVWSAQWENKYNSFEQKYQTLLEYMTSLKRVGKVVSLVGISAGASLVCNLFAKNPNTIYKVVNVCGRLVMQKSGLPKFEIITFRNKEYIKSVRNFESLEPAITDLQKKRIMIFNGMYDELVPISTIRLDGAVNRFVPLIGHNFCISYALLFYKSKILDFLTS